MPACIHPIRTLALGSVAVGALVTFAGAARAQQAPADEPALEEIVVTAQHREELLRDVPIAVNAVSAKALENIGVADTSALVQAVPSLNFTRSGPSGIFVIRGVATPNGSAGEEGSTAVYVDDVYMPDLASTINTFNNIQRIEVLNGPQGTLFGRNAAGGLIRVITREPDDVAQVKAQAGFGNYDVFTGQLYAAAPLSSRVAVDLAFTGQDQGRGFGYDPTLGKRVRTQDYWGLRGKLVARPTDTLKITLARRHLQRRRHQRDIRMAAQLRATHRNPDRGDGEPGFVVRIPQPHEDPRLGRQRQGGT